MKNICLMAALLAASLSTAALAQGLMPGAETQSGSATDAKAVTPSTSASTSASTKMGGSSSAHEADIAAANAADPDRATKSGLQGNAGTSSSGNVVPNGTMTANPPASGASSEATLNEHGETGTGERIDAIEGQKTNFAFRHTAMLLSLDISPWVNAPRGILFVPSVQPRK